jgi:hypothetical protein
VVRRLLTVVVVLVCAGGVIAYQVSRPTRAPANPRVFVPSARFFLDFSPSFRTSLADAYYLAMVQYYGEHVNGDGRIDALPQMVDLVTRLSSHFTRAYVFGALAFSDAGRPDLSVKLLERGFAANPDYYVFPALLGYYSYQYGTGSKQENDAAGSRWYQRAAAIPGSPSYLLRLAAVLAGKGGQEEKAVVMWGQVYAAGDKYARQKAVEGLDLILPAEKVARMKAVAPLSQTMPKADYEALLAELFKGYAP